MDLVTLFKNYKLNSFLILGRDGYKINIIGMTREYMEPDLDGFLPIHYAFEYHVDDVKDQIDLIPLLEQTKTSTTRINIEQITAVSEPTDSMKEIFMDVISKIETEGEHGIDFYAGARGVAQ